MAPSIIVAIILVVAAVIFLAKWVRIVPQGYEWTVESASANTPARWRRGCTF